MNKLYCEDCGEKRDEENRKVIRGYCPKHLKENMPQQTLKEEKKKLLISLLATSGEKLIRDSLEEIDFIIDRTTTHVLEQRDREEVLNKRDIFLLKELAHICREDDLLDLDDYDSISRSDTIGNAWEALKVIDKLQANPSDAQEAIKLIK